MQGKPGSTSRTSQLLIPTNLFAWMDSMRGVAWRRVAADTKTRPRTGGCVAIAGRLASLAVVRVEISLRRSDPCETKLFSVQLRTYNIVTVADTLVGTVSVLLKNYLNNGTFASCWR